MSTTKLLVAMVTCHDRREQTLACLRSFFAQDVDGLELRAVVVDDGSTDGTADAVASEFTACTVIPADGTLYWARGMATAEAEAVRAAPGYLLWLNDDVVLSPTAARTLVDIANAVREPVVVSGALVDPTTGEDSYGAVRRVDWHPLRYALIHPNGTTQDADTCHGNVLLVPATTLAAVGGIDGGFAHGYADFDYGLRVRKAGGRVLLSPSPVGACAANDMFDARTRAAGTLRERVRVIRDVKGRPWRSEVRYLRRHAGVLGPAVMAIPYLKAVGASGRRRRARQRTDDVVVMLEGTASDYRAPLYRELIAALDAQFVLAADTASQAIESAVTEAGGRFEKVQARRRTTRWTHTDGFADTATVVLFTRVFSLLRREHPSTIVVTEMGLRTAQAALYKILHPRTRLVVWARLSERSESGRSLPRLLLRRILVRFATTVIVNGESGARYCRSIGVASKRIVVIPQVSAIVPASQEELDNRRPSAGTPTLLYVGQLVPRKGVDLLIRAVSATPHSLHIRIIGSGPELDRLMSMTAALAVSAEFVDWIDDPAQLRKEYLAADFFVLPSLADEWGLVVVEALSQGTPVLGSEFAQAVTELVTPGQNGLAFRPDEPADLVQTLDIVTRQEPAEWQRWSQAASRSVAQLTPASVARRFAAVVRDR